MLSSGGTRSNTPAVTRSPVISTETQHHLSLLPSKTHPHRSAMIVRTVTWGARGCLRWRRGRCCCWRGGRASSLHCSPRTCWLSLPGRKVAPGGLRRRMISRRRRRSVSAAEYWIVCTCSLDTAKLHCM